MKTSTDHPPIDDLVSMLAGDLSGERTDGLIQHVESCARCQQRVESIWAEVSPLSARAPEEMDDALAAATEEGLRGRLRRTELAESMVGLGTHGFLFVMLGLLRPLVHVMMAMSPQPARRQ